MKHLVFSVMILATVMLAVAMPSNRNATASPGVVTEDLSGPLTPDDLANTLLGAGVTISNVTYTGVDIAGGTFSGGAGIIGFEEGIILSSGDIANVVGPNVEDGITTITGTPGDPDLDALSGFPTFDATVLEFDFVPDADMVFFEYVFASDEYNEFVDSPFNDVFAFIVNGVNCATVNGDPVSVNTINNGNPFGIGPSSHAELYINNDLSDGGGAIDTEMDGLTVVLVCEASVTPGDANHIKLAIADASDQILDSNVLLKAGSFSTTPPPEQVIIDIKPGSDPNSIRLTNRGVIPVAILTTEDFDATTVDADTVCFAGDCSEADGTGHVEDVDGDGDLDLVLHFETGETDIAPGDTEACLTAQTFDGTPIDACDSVRTL